MGCGAAFGSEWIFYVVLAVGFIALIVFSSKKRKKDAEAYQERMDSLVKGVKVLTIGGIIGEIVESTEKDVVIKTGLEETPSFIRMDKRGISGPIVEEPQQEVQQEQQAQQEQETEEVFSEFEAEQEDALKENEENLGEEIQE